mmetsp:Transcript_21877/g.57070  ORF Transcript_21877/g.57070 Transcript_21877/m.57070 type:complete len:112 (+) Transcript_21877:2252-2587(+)
MAESDEWSVDTPGTGNSAGETASAIGTADDDGWSADSSDTDEDSTATGDDSDEAIAPPLKLGRGAAAPNEGAGGRAASAGKEGRCTVCANRRRLEEKGRQAERQGRRKAHT